MLTGGLMAVKRKRKVEDVLTEAFKYSGLYTDSKKHGVRLPMLIKKDGNTLTYRLPVGLCASDFYKQWERLEQATNGEILFSFQKGEMTMEILSGVLPGERRFHFPEFPEEYRLGVPIGWSRAGLILEDLAEMPHLLVAGQTYGGKSVFLHGVAACLVGKCELYVIDLARAEFSYLKDNAEFAYKVKDALKILEFLSRELDKRLEVLDKAKVEKIQSYKGEMPYMVLIVDEFSALSPDFIKDRKDPERLQRQKCHSLMVDILARARKVGIHVILSTQRPDKDVLPGIMKANIPATVCFKVRNRVNSEICLDHGRAALLPDVKGRAIWQFREEREVQVMHLSPQQARSFLPSSPIRSENPLIADGEF